jgi:transcriptional regulator GlxA family with amidase domain
VWVLVVCGIRAGQCCETAARVASDLTRRFVAATGMTPLRYQQVLRVERAEHLIGHGETVEAAARTVGFADARMLRRLRSRADAGLRSPSRL